MKQALDEKLFRLMVNRAQDYAIFMLDRGGNIMSWNTGAARIKQYKADEIIGRHFSVFYAPEDVARNWPAHELATALREGRFEDEGWRVRKDGSRFWANVVITALRDDDGNLLGYSKITRDFSARRRVEEALRQSEERFRLLVDGVQDYAIYMLDPDGVVTSWNVGARRIKGYEASEILGRHFACFYEAADIEAGRPWTELAMAREHGRAEDEGWRVRKNGTRFWARVVVTALHGAGGELLGFAKVTQDLTQRRHAESLEDSSRRINDFIAVLAHELRNPLAPIRNAVAVLERVKGPAEVEQMRRTIDRQSAQLSRIVDDLLDISRVTRGTLNMQRGRLDASELIARAVEAARPGIEAARHTLVLRIPHGEHPIEGDAVRLAQALTNILNNAARYTNAGGRITVSMRGHSGAGAAPMIEIRVADTGQGIEPQLIGSIFGMFVQGRSIASRPQTGLGVGLALARSIVELHQGTLDAHSEGAGKGSEFIMRLPAMSASEARTPAAAALQARPVPPLPAKRVLVVDDNADAASMLSELLRALGHDVVTVNGGTEALQAAERFRPEIILLDLGMPGMSGFEVARRLRARKHSPEPLIVAVTGWGKIEDEIRGREAGFDMHLVKPLETEQLHRLFERASQTRH